MFRGKGFSRRPSGGFTLVELLVVIAIIGVLIALLLPAVQQAREAARRIQCTNNLKQMALSLHTYHDTNRQMPPGHIPEKNLGSAGWVRFGSWFVRILPYVEQKAAYDQSQRPGGTLDNQTASWAAPTLAWQAMNTARVNTFWCPSSPLPRTYTQQTGSKTQSAGAPATIEVQIPDYAANAGCVFRGGTTNTQHSTTFWGWGGRSADNGVIPSFFSSSTGAPPWPGQKVDFAAISDGTSNTIAIGEQSNFYMMDKDVRAGYVRGGFWNGGTSSVMGQDMANYVVTAFPINAISVGWPGTSRNENVTYSNTPYRSAHPGGAQFALADGSVRFVAETVNFATYTALMDRGDGVPVGEY